MKLMIATATCLLALTAGEAFANCKANSPSAKCEEAGKDMDKTIEVDPWVVANLEELESETRELGYDSDGDPTSVDFTKSVVYTRANADHKVTIEFTAIELGGKCVPLFEPDGASESDGVLGVLTVNDLKASEDESDATCVGTNNIKTGVIEFSRDVDSIAHYEYEITATGQSGGGAVSFADGIATVGDAPAGKYTLSISVNIGLDTDVAFAGS